MGISRVAEGAWYRSVITGFKAEGYATSGGTENGAPYLADNSGDRPTVEENVLRSGATNGDCYYYWAGYNRPTLEDTTHDIKQYNLESFQVLENVTDGTFAIARGSYGNNNISCSNIFDPGDSYRIHGFMKASPTNWQNHFQGNVIKIVAGTGIGEWRTIIGVTDVGGEVRFWLNQAFSAIDGTSQYRIYYNWHTDPIYNNAGAGYFHFDQDKGLYLFHAELVDELEVGDSGGTATGLAQGIVSGSIKDDFSTSAWWDTIHQMFDNVDVLVGVSWTPSTYLAGDSSVIIGMGDNNRGGISPVFGSASGRDPNKVWASGAELKSGGYGGSFEEVYFAVKGSQLLSFYGAPFGSCPVSADVVGAFVRWTGGYWGEPFAGLGASVANNHVVGVKGEPINDPPSVGRGLGWLGGNTGSDGDFTTEIRDTNLQLVGKYLDSGRLVDFWKFDYYNPYDFSIFITKTINRTIIDAVTKEALQNVRVTIKDVLGNIISYQSTGASLGESVNKTETDIITTDDSVFTPGNRYQFDHERLICQSIVGAGNRVVFTRAAELSIYFPALPHEDAMDYYDPLIYELKTLLTDANGQIPAQVLPWANCIHRQNDDTYSTQVIGPTDGLNYTCILGHTADDTNKPPNVTYWQQTGGQGVPWESGLRCVKGNPGVGASFDKSYAKMLPWTIEYELAGYTKKLETITTDIVSFDSEGDSKVIELERSPIFIDQEAVLV